jgi:DNA-binding response OmpR family regulator
MKNQDFNILVTDDNKETLRMIALILLYEGYMLALAQNGENALKIIEENEIDLILLDIQMPGSLNGFDVCRRLKSNRKTKNIPVIFLSAQTDTKNTVKGFKAGGVDFITKPVHKEELLARVNTQVKLKSFTDELNNRVNYR